MVAPLTINGNVVATAADVEKVRFPGPKGDKGDPGNDGVGLPGPAGRDGIDAVGLPGPQGPAGKDAVGLPGKDGMDGMDGMDGKDGADGKNGANFDPAVMQEGVKTNKLQLGNKFLLSGVGDAHANDDWLRMFDKDGKGYNGGFAAGRLWTPSLYSNSAGTNLMGGTSVHNPNKWGTHLPWHGDNKNYIRGDTEIRGNTNNIGDMNVEGKLHFKKNQNSNDPYHIEKIIHSPDNTSLRLTINDNSDESLQIWGDSCRTTGCGGEGVPRFKFFADGRLCIGDTCITEGDLKQLSKRGRKEVVHRRPIFGIGKLPQNDKVFSQNAGKTRLIPHYVYGPFGYGVPPVQAGATRKFRIYAVWNDNFRSGVGPSLEFRMGWSENEGVVTFNLPITWGDISSTRDGFSNEADGKGHHSQVYTFSNGESYGSWMFHYIEIQTLDIWP